MARRRRELLALSRQLDAALGPDCSELVVTLAAGWSIRRLARLDDQLREGELMHNCLRGLVSPDPNCWSLRDPDNLPHLSFSVWSIGRDDDLSEVVTGDAPIGGVYHFLAAGGALLGVDGGRAIKPAHLQRLREFGDTDAAASAPRFPTDTAGRTAEAARAVDPLGEIVALLGL